MLLSRGGSRSARISFYNIIFSPERLLRFFSTNNSDRFLSIENNYKQLKLIVPLPSKGKRAFTIPTGQIRSFIDDLKIEDSTITDVDIIDQYTGLRISRSMNIDRLLEYDWKLRINDITYYVCVPSTANPKIQGKSHLEKIKEWFNQVKVEKDILTYQEFIHKCQDLGVTELQGKEILRDLTKHGVVFYYEYNLELQQKILLNPSLLFSALEKVLNIDYIKLSPESKQAYIQSLQKELAPLSLRHLAYLSRAKNRVQVICGAVLIGLICQWLLFARLTWWDYSWDVIEPVTYFTTAVQMILAGYLFYLVHKEDYTNTQVKNIFVLRLMRKFKKREGFDEEKFKYLNNKLQFALQELEYNKIN